VTGLLDLSSRPKGMRVIARNNRPHPGAQLRFTDVDGHRVTCSGRIVRGARRLRLRLATRWPWATLITAAMQRLRTLAPG
jgi:hypothetical protein